MTRNRPINRRTPQVFRGSYTHKGRLVRTKGWCVKIQHQGVRRTLSLKARLREEAEIEARQLHARIVARGWEAASLPGEEGAAGETKNDSAYWQDRLVQRKYPVADFRETQETEWSARIAHRGVGSYFPLRTDDRAQAAERAREIQRQLNAEGWDAVCRDHPREVTLGIHWASNPVVWTYTTFHTRTVLFAERAWPRLSGSAPVVVIEPEESLRRTLRYWCGATAGFACSAAYATGAEALDRVDREWRGLYLVNHSLPDVPAHVCIERLRQRAPGAFGFVFSAYEDSEQLFVATPGGAAAYVYRRVPPNRLLEPLTARPLHGPVTEENLRQHLRRYVDDTLKPGTEPGPNRQLESLTARERQILELLSGGFVDKEMAARLGISVWTVHGHVKHIFEKLGVRSRTEAVVKYLQK